MPHEWFDHTADVGLQVRAHSIDTLFAEAAAALGLALATPKRPAAVDHISLTVNGLDKTDLMINWLRTLLALWTDTGARVISADIHDIADQSLRAGIRLDTAPVPPHDMGHDIKAVTYHQARVAVESDGSWIARVIFDV